MRRKLRFHPHKPNLKPQFPVGKSPAKKVGGYRSYPVTTPTGKGNKDRKIVVSDAMLKALKRYRRFRGLSPLPAQDDIEPLVPKRLGKGPMRSTRHLREIIQDCFDKAYEQMLQDGLEEDAGELRSATVHWLRHTGISEDVKNRPREHVRDDAGHSSFQTTEKYIDVEDRERHQSGKKKLIKEL